MDLFISYLKTCIYLPKVGFKVLWFSNVFCGSLPVFWWKEITLAVIDYVMILVSVYLD